MNVIHLTLKVVIYFFFYNVCFYPKLFNYFIQNNRVKTSDSWFTEATVTVR